MDALIDSIASLSLGAADSKASADPKANADSKASADPKANADPKAEKPRKKPVLSEAAKASLERKRTGPDVPEEKQESRQEHTQGMEASAIDRLHARFASHSDERIRLLRRRDVLQWLFGDFSFLPPIERKNKTKDTLALKPLEDAWGQQVLRDLRPDLRLEKQWTNLFGEYLCQEIQVALGKTPFTPVIRNGFHPDIETEDQMVESKAGTYFTTGTAHEKIAGVFFKYADVPALYGKPLVVVCLGGAERLAREHYGLLAGEKCTPQKQRILDFHRSHGVEVVGATEMLIRLL